MLESVQILGSPAFGDDTGRIGPLKPVTILFGANGSGKTTLSRAIADSTRYGGTTFTWAPGTAATIKVYNRDYVDDTLQQAENLPGVFTLGKASAEIQAEIAALSGPSGSITRTKTLLATQRGTLQGMRDQIADARDLLKEAAWRARADVPDELKAMFVGFNNNKERLLNQLLSTAAAHQISAETLDALSLEAAVLDDDAVTRDALPTHAAAPLEQLAGFDLLGTPVVGSADVRIAPLIDKLQNADWVEHGRVYLHESDAVCPFCQQSTPDDLVALLDGYFDTRYVEQVRSLQQFRAMVMSWAESWKTYLDAVAAHPSASDHLDPRFSTARERLLREIDNLTSTVDRKLVGPSAALSIATPEAAQDAVHGLVTEANSVIHQFNDRLRDRARLRTNLLERAWAAFARITLISPTAQYEASMPPLLQAQASLQGAIKRTEQTIQENEARLRELQGQVTSSKPIIERINGLLAAAGFHSFRLEESSLVNDGYTIRRANGEVASETLSEGERTFITFLYFTQSLEGTPRADTELDDLVVVIDDPISSLDSDVLYAVSTLVRRVMANIAVPTGRVRQVILLTHNAHFHKEVAYESRPGRAGLRVYGVVRKHFQRPSDIELTDTNPVRTAYAALWDEAKRAADDPYTSVISLQNILRRIIETYFKVLGDVDTDAITAKFGGAEQVICRALFSWINAGSHSIFDDLHFSPSGATVEMYLDVFERIFQEQDQHGHYRMMMRIEVDGTKRAAADVA
ncbi:AAA family ATPase [Salinibacterium sp. ZJ450]|uniref:AAA family ATPase n=1 Tax=Salinibacterium sp. ZJ450 TaxID=2708338 RepID=UPI0014231CA0|nr:AAA family ATPase [Salinibacterium sp. ZJ450]